MCLPLLAAPAAGAAAGGAASSVGLAIGALGTVVSAIGAYQQQAAANASAEYNARIQERNAQVAKMEAEHEIYRGQKAEQKHRRQVRQILSKQRVGYAAGGVTVDTGSPLTIAEETARLGEEDALTIRHNSQMSAWAKRQQAAGYTADANLSRMRKSSPVLPVFSSVLSSASPLVERYAFRN